jgi:hypothetical protein
LSRERSISACQPRPGFVGHTVAPCGIQLAAAIFVDEFAPVDAGLIGQFYHGAVNRHDTLVDAVKLINQRFDPVIVQVKRIHQFHNLGAQFLILGFLCR